MDEVTYENKEYASRKSFKRTDKRTHRNICDTTAVKRKRQFEEGKNGRKTAKDVREEEKRQPQVSRDSQESRDHCGSKRRRVQEERGDCIEKTKKKAGENTMMERLEGDEAIE